MDLVLIGSAALMGLAGTPHCLAMCGPACAAMGATGGATARQGGGSVALGFHLGRISGYSAAGAVAAAGVSLIGAVSAAMPVLRPLWSLVHVAALGLGLWLLITGRQPAWFERLRRSERRETGTAVVAWMPTARSIGCGALWVAWPCGLLHSAIVVAALANGAAAGAVVMAAFAIASGAGLVGAASIGSRVLRQRSRGASIAWAVRAAGLMLAAASAWALGHGLWARVLDACQSW
jgi:uncharacterized protein